MMTIYEAYKAYREAEDAENYDRKAVRVAKDNLRAALAEVQFTGEAKVNGVKTGCNTANGLANWIMRKELDHIEITFGEEFAESFAEKFNKMTEAEKLQLEVERRKAAEAATYINCYDEF